MSEDTQSTVSSAINSEMHERTLPEGIRDMRSNLLLFDVTLDADGEGVPAHKLVLASCSDYFKTMFAEIEKRRFELKGITAKMLSSLVEFAYSGKIGLSMETIEEVLSAASNFQMKALVEVCAEYLTGEMSIENIVDIVNLSEKYAIVDTVCDETANYIETFLPNHFKEVSEDNLLKLTAKQLTDIIMRNSLLIESEFCLFEKVMTWIERTTDLAEDTAFDILSKIRFPLMSTEELSKVGEREIMKSYPRCQELLSEALEYHKDVLKQPLMQNEKTRVRDELKAFIVASENTMHIIITDYSWGGSGSAKLRAIESTAHDFRLKDIVVVDNFLYASHVLHSDPDSVHFHRYDPRFDVWQRLPEPAMKWDLSLVLIPYKKKIYAVDGANDTPLQLELFSIENNKWETKASVQNRNRWFAGHAFQDKIYISGGEDSGKFDHRVYCYTPSSDTWETKAPMVKARKNHKMAEINNKLYAFGGDDADSVEYYLPGDDQWTLCERNLEFPVCGLIEDNEHVYLLRMEPVYDDFEIDGKAEKGEIIYERYSSRDYPLTTPLILKFSKNLMCVNLTLSKNILEKMEVADKEGDVAERAESDVAEVDISGVAEEGGGGEIDSDVSE